MRVNRDAQCELCPSKFSKQYNLYAHYRRDHQIDPFSIDSGLISARPTNLCCPFCDQYFNHRGYLTRHVRRWHDPQWSPNEYLATIRLQAASYPTTTTTSQPRVKRPQCPFCDEYFKLSRSLIQHVQHFHNPYWTESDHNEFLANIRLGSQPKVNYSPSNDASPTHHPSHKT